VQITVDARLRCSARVAACGALVNVDASAAGACASVTGHALACVRCSFSLASGFGCITVVGDAWVDTATAAGRESRCICSVVALRAYAHAKNDVHFIVSRCAASKRPGGATRIGRKVTR